MKEKRQRIPDMIPEDLRQTNSKYEQTRVRYEGCQDVFTLPALVDRIQKDSGARLVVMNTVQSAAVVARELKSRGVSTLHLSTALAPVHRRPILDKIILRLKDQRDLDWVLVATSCVEAGVDFSFANAYRERCRVTSLVQIGGRVNRHGERGTGVVWDFTTNDPLLTQNPAFRDGRSVVAELFRKDLWSGDLTALMTKALEMEFKRCSDEGRISALWEKEQMGAYPSVAELTRLIDTDTRLVVINPDLAAAIESGDRVDRKGLLLHSVQLWTSKIGHLALKKIGQKDEIYSWDYKYDPDFLGCMEGILALKAIDQRGFELL